MVSNRDISNNSFSEGIFLISSDSKYICVWLTDDITVKMINQYNSTKIFLKNPKRNYMFGQNSSISFG